MQPSWNSYNPGFLDADFDIAGLYLLNSDNQSHIEEPIALIQEPTELYLLKKEEMDWRKPHKTNGYDLWHQQLMHCPNKVIQ
jgi:hypothetical protein